MPGTVQALCPNQHYSYSPPVADSDEFEPRLRALLFDLEKSVGSSAAPGRRHSACTAFLSWLRASDLRPTFLVLDVSSTVFRAILDETSESPVDEAQWESKRIGHIEFPSSTWTLFIRHPGTQDLPHLKTLAD